MCWCTKNFHWNSINRHISISAIVFRFYLVCKTSYHYLGIVKTTQHILKCSTTSEFFTVCVATVISPYNMYIWKVGSYFFISRIYKLVLKSAIDVSIIKRYFLLYNFQVAQNPNFVNTNGNFSFHPVFVFHALYNVKLSNKHENVLKEVCWNDSYLIIGLKYQYMVN